MPRTLHTLAVIAVLPIGLIGLEHGASYLLNILRALATTHRFSFFLATSVVTVDAHPVYAFRVYGARMEAESEADYLFRDDSASSLGRRLRFIPTWQAVTRSRRNLAEEIILILVFSPSTTSYDYAPSPHQNYYLEARHPRRSTFRVIVPISPPEIRPVRSGVYFANASRFKVLRVLRVIRSTLGVPPSLRKSQAGHRETLDPLLHKYAPKSSFISHFFFRNFLKTPVMTPYSYTPVAQALMGARRSINRGGRALPGHYWRHLCLALANPNRARAAAALLSAALNRPAGSSAPSLSIRARDVPEPVSPSIIRVQQPAATPPPLSSATSKGAVPPTHRVQAPLPKGNLVPPTSTYIPCSTGAATPSDSEDIRIPWASEGKWSAGSPPSRLSAGVAPSFL
ncbi:hypothetical protein FB451DRAFT_1479067 [Mycena latifolia]|nr:hypothetical protein FB451DRAFT_1479067 [Mycena latifolia]